MAEHEPDFDAEFSELLGGGESPQVDPAKAHVQKFTRALWELFGGAHNRQVGDARTVGFTVTAELVDSAGNRWIRHFAADGEGNQLPPWQLKGYLEDARDWARLIYEQISAEIKHPEEE